MVLVWSSECLGERDTEDTSERSQSGQGGLSEMSLRSSDLRSLSEAARPRSRRWEHSQWRDDSPEALWDSIFCPKWGHNGGVQTKCQLNLGIRVWLGRDLAADDHPPATSAEMLPMIQSQIPGTRLVRRSPVLHMNRGRVERNLLFSVSLLHLWFTTQASVTLPTWSSDVLDMGTFLTLFCDSLWSFVFSGIYSKIPALWALSLSSIYIYIYI
jgi:hypothetical protein